MDKNAGPSATLFLGRVPVAGARPVSQKIARRMLERDKSGRPTPISPERFEICYKIVSKDNTGGHCEELNDMHQRHVDEEKNMDKSEP